MQPTYEKLDTRREGWQSRPLVRLWGWPYLAPALVAVAAVLLIPVVYGVAQSFRSVDPTDPFSTGQFAGFANYARLLGSSEFLLALSNTVAWVAFNLIGQTCFGIALALALNGKHVILGCLRTLVFLPWAVPAVLAGMFWKMLLSPETSFLPHALVAIGLITKSSDFLANPTVALAGSIIAYQWIGVPFFAMTTLAALQTISPDLYEAHKLDGGTPIDSFFAITLPAILPTLLISILLRSIWISNFGDLIWVMTQGGPDGMTQILPTFIYNQAFLSLDAGAATSAATLQILALLIYATIILRIRTRLNNKAAS